jgi:hypothetical protein
MLRTNRKIWTLGAVVAVASGLAYVHAADVAEDDANHDADALVSAARKTYSRMISRLGDGEPVSVDEVYLWSRRLADAVGRVNPPAGLHALKVHERNMRELHDIWSKRVKEGAAFDTGATDYYLLEAKILVFDATRAQRRILLADPTSN